MTQPGLTPAEFEARRWAYADYVSRFGWDAGTQYIKRPIVNTVERTFIECIETGERFETAAQAAKRFGCVRSSIFAAVYEGRPVHKAKGGPKSFRRVTVAERVVTNRRSA